MTLCLSEALVFEIFPLDLPAENAPPRTKYLKRTIER